MDRIKIVGRFWFFAAGVVVVAMVLCAGCQRKKERTGKYNEEEMASIPLAQRSELPALSGGLSLSVDNETITVDEIVDQIEGMLEERGASRDFEVFNQQTRKGISDVVTGKVSEILLYQKARKTAPPNIDEVMEDTVESAVNRFVTNYNGNWAQAQAAIEQMGFDWQSFRDYQKKLMVTQSYVSKELEEDLAVGYREMIEYYNAHREERYEWEGVIEFRLIDIDGTRLDTADYGDVSPGAAALHLAEELLERIADGADFGQLAQEYSHGHRATIGGLWTPVSETASLVAPYDVVVSQAWEMEVGEVQGPVQTGGRVFIIKVENKKVGGVEPFENIQETIESEILFIRRRARYQKLMTDLLDQIDVANMEVFVDYCVKEAYHRYMMTLTQAEIGTGAGN